MKYAELHCKSNFSFLCGASHASELVARAKELGYSALAVTDRNTLAGIVRAHGAAKDSGLKLIVGAEITPVDGPPVVLWVTDRPAYGRLCRLITVGRRRAEKGESWLCLEDIAEHAEGLIAGVHPLPWGEGGSSLRETGESRNQSRNQRGRESFSAKAVTTWLIDDRKRLPTPSAQSLMSSLQPPASSLSKYRDIFGPRAYLLAEFHYGPDDRRRLTELRELSRRSHMPLLAAGDVHYHVRSRLPLFDVLTATRHGMTVNEAREELFTNAERHLHSLEEIENRFVEIPQAVHRTLEVAEQCTFSLDELKYEYPEELAPAGLSPLEHLTRLTWRGARWRYPDGAPEKVTRLIKHELALIGELHYEAYFLTVWDLVRFARSRGILCQGRGSAANSVVCFCLGVTAVDPQRADLLFERFVSKERNEAPDIDVDFEHERREEVLQYIYNKYGRERAGMTAEVICYRTRSAVRDVGKALGLSLDRVNALAKIVEGYRGDAHLAEKCEMAGIDPESDIGKRLIHSAHELVGFPRHLSQHVGGMVITQGPLCELCPIENAAMEGRTVIEWDKDDLDELGILKIDCLSLGMLTAIRKGFELVKSSAGRELTLATIPEGDEGVYDMICRADTMGVFQIESRAQMSMLPRLKPRCYYDLVIEVAIVRPGPIQGNMVHPYLRRRSGEEPVEYPNDAIREALQKTLGVPIFQEQAMRLAVVAAGFTPGEADQLRRAMGAWRRPGVIDQFHKKLIDGMKSRGLSDEFAGNVFRQIRGFGEYGFPESHAASFALLVYVSAYLKRYYPAAFCAAVINSQPMGFYQPAQLIRDARDHGVTVLPVDVNCSAWDCTLERSSDCRLQIAIRLGFRLIDGFSRTYAEKIVEERHRGGAYRNVRDFAKRTGFAQSTLTRLAEADALKSVSEDRRAALWQTLAEEKSGAPRPLFANLADDEDEDVALAAALPRLTDQEQVFLDYRMTGLSLRDHPVAFYREELDSVQITPAGQLTKARDGRHIRVAGIVLLRQRPATAKGITFVTIEDETGVANLVIKPDVWQRHYPMSRRAAGFIAHGKLESRHGVIHVVVARLEDLSETLAGLKTTSRDFR